MPGWSRRNAWRASRSTGWSSLPLGRWFRIRAEFGTAVSISGIGRSPVIAGTDCAVIFHRWRVPPSRSPVRPGVRDAEAVPAAHSPIGLHTGRGAGQILCGNACTDAVKRERCFPGRRGIRFPGTGVPDGESEPETSSAPPGRPGPRTGRPCARPGTAPGVTPPTCADAPPKITGHGRGTIGHGPAAPGMRTGERGRPYPRGKDLPSRLTPRLCRCEGSRRPSNMAPMSRSEGTISR